MTAYEGIEGSDIEPRIFIARQIALECASRIYTGTPTYDNGHMTALAELFYTFLVDPNYKPVDIRIKPDA